MKLCSLAAFIVNSFEYTMGKKDLAVKTQINPAAFLGNAVAQWYGA